LPGGPIAPGPCDGHAVRSVTRAVGSATSSSASSRRDYRNRACTTRGMSNRPEWKAISTGSGGTGPLALGLALGLPRRAGGPLGDADPHRVEDVARAGRDLRETMMIPVVAGEDHVVARRAEPRVRGHPCEVELIAPGIGLRVGMIEMKERDARGELPARPDELPYAPRLPPRSSTVPSVDRLVQPAHRDDGLLVTFGVDPDERGNRNATIETLDPPAG